MAVAKSIFKSIFKGYGSGFAGGEGGIPGLLSLWNAKTPTVCPVGPQIQTSAAGNQPDANGNMVPWPVNHPGKGVMVQPAYSNLLQNSKFEGAVSGTPGTAPTGWSRYGVGEILITALSVGNSVTFKNTVSSQNFIYRAIIGLANTSYNCFALVACNGNISVVNIISNASAPADAVITYMVDGVVANATDKPPAGSHTIATIVTLTATAGVFSVRFGNGCIGNAIGNLTISTPQIVASSYRMPYAASGAGATTSVTSTAATSGGNGMAIPLNAAMTAALSGGAFTVAALCWMGVGSGELTSLTQQNLTSFKDNTESLFFRGQTPDGVIVGSTDGTSWAEMFSVITARGEIHLRAVRTNAARTHFQVGYRRYTSAMVPIDAGVVWGALVAYDQSMNPLTHLRFGYGLTVPIGFLQVQMWNKSASDAEILKVVGYAL